MALIVAATAALVAAATVAVAIAVYDDRKAQQARERRAMIRAAARLGAD